MVNGNGEELKQKTLDLLRHNPEGLTIADISKKLGAHRQTVTKYIFELKGAKKIRIRTIGPASLVYLNGGVRHA